MSGTMGYMDLISLAAAKHSSASRQKEYDKKTDIGKEKKLNPKEIKLKVGVQKFLAKKEEEERKRKAEAQLKKRKLLEMRNQDRKATTRVRKMLNMTKSANKSCIADADMSFSDSCTAQASETQPDEDDYGYTSSSAAAWHKKMLEKYQATPKIPPQSNKQKVEPPKSQKLDAPSTSKSNHSSAPLSVNESRQEFRIENSQKPKKKVIVQPPAFIDLLRLAEEKSKEPVVLKKPVKEISDGPEFEYGRPMTAKEKAKYQSELVMKQRVQAAFSGKAAPKLVPKLSDNNASKFVSNVDSKQADMPKQKMNTSKTADIIPQPPRGIPPKTDKRVVVNQNSNSFQSASSKVNTSSKVVLPEKIITNHNVQITGKSSSRENKPSLSQPKINNNPPKLVKKDEAAYRNNLKNLHSSQNEPSQRPKVKQSVDNFQQKPRPPHKQPVKQSESRYRDEMAPPQRKENKPWKGRSVIHSDEEYDSEMDDFIDDSDIPGEDISSVIGQIFGYNKRKYADEDSGDECMESSVVQQWQEEQRSLRIGIKEDEEELRREEEEKKRKAQMLQRKRKLQK